MTADEFQYQISTNRTNGFVTLSLPLAQRLPEKAMTVNMTKFNIVRTYTSDNMENIVTRKMRRTSAVYGELEVARENMYLKDKGE